MTHSVIKGDRVRLRRDNGDEATVVVTAVGRNSVENETNFFLFKDDESPDGWVLVDVLARAKKPEPTQRGVYRDLNGGAVWILTPTASWPWVVVESDGTYDAYKKVPQGSLPLTLIEESK